MTWYRGNGVRAMARWAAMRVNLRADIIRESSARLGRCASGVAKVVRDLGESALGDVASGCEVLSGCEDLQRRARECAVDLERIVIAVEPGGGIRRAYDDQEAEVEEARSAAWSEVAQTRKGALESMLLAGGEIMGVLASVEREEGLLQTDGGVVDIRDRGLKECVEGLASFEKQFKDWKRLLREHAAWLRTLESE